MPWTLVTGAAKRLGAEICGQIAAQGYPVVIHYNTSQVEAEAAVTGLRRLGAKAECIQGDFSTPQSVQEFIERYTQRFPDTQNLINNVGNYLIKSALQTDQGEWLDLFQTNLNAPAALINALIPSIAKHKGNIINIGVTGIETPYADTYSPAYTITKFGLWLLTKSLAKELAAKQVRVNMVSPGLLENAVDLQQNLSKIPMQRPGKLEEVARVVLFLLDPASGYITGQNIEVAGAVRL